MRLLKAFVPTLVFVSSCASVAPQPANSLTIDTLRSLPTQSYDLDPATARMGFLARPIGFPAVKGEFQEFDGTVTIKNAAEDSIDVEAIVNLDSVEIGSSWYESMVRSEAWFDVEHHPEAIFKGSLTGWTDAGIGMVEGKMTIRGVTQPAEFQIILDCEDLSQCPSDNVGFLGEIELSRAAFGMTAFRGVVRDQVKLTVAGELSASEVQRMAAKQN